MSEHDEQTPSDSETETSSSLEAGGPMGLPGFLDEKTASEEVDGQDDTQFLADVSRSMRDGLGAIVGYCDLLIEEVEGQANQDLCSIRGAAHQVLSHLSGLEMMINRERRKHRMAVGMRKIAELVAGSPELSEVAPKILDTLAQMVDVQAIQLWLDRGGVLELFAEYDAETASSSLVSSARDDRLDQQVRLLEESSIVTDSDDQDESSDQPWLAVPVTDSHDHNYIGLLRFCGQITASADVEYSGLFNTLGKHVGEVIGQIRRFGLVHRQATVDELTGVNNRRQFFDVANVEFARARQNQTPLTLLLLDIDHFKAVNDTHGHLAGDRILQGVAQVLDTALRGNDMLARYGGEEFVVLLHGTPLEPDGKAVAERLRQQVASSSFPIGEDELSCSVSIGVAELSETTENLNTLLNQADQALYKAKERGRNRVVAAASTSG